MSNNHRLHTITVPLRRICSALPAVALLSGGIALSAPAAPAHELQSTAAASGSPAIVVPDTALTWPSSAALGDDRSPLAGPNAPEAPAPKPLAPLLPADAVPGGSSMVTLDSTGIPVRALEAYRQAATLTDAADPACKIDWALVAAIGRVESNHARFGGNQLDAAGVAQPGIIGIALDGTNGTARITDTDRGVLDRDTIYDRAVGPMQFIPGSWRVGGVDGDGDGVKNPQDMTDAAAATAVYLCSGPGDLSRPADLRSAILRYNASDSYAQMVTAIADAYRHGVSAIPATDLAPAKPAAVAPRDNNTTANTTSTGTAVPGPGTTPAKATVPPPPLAPRAAATASPTSAPTQPTPTSTTPTSTTPTSTTPTSTTPTSTTPTSTTPTSTTPTSMTATTPASTTTTTTAPTCLPTPSDGATPTGTATAAEPCVTTPCAPATVASATPIACSTPGPTA